MTKQETMELLASLVNMPIGSEAKAAISQNILDALPRQQYDIDLTRTEYQRLNFGPDLP